MNLKEAFRFQNKLQTLMDEAQGILCRDSNVTKVENTYLRKKVMAEAEDETTVENPDMEYSEQITEVAGFLLYLLGEREALAKDIRTAKDKLPIDMDSEVSINRKRQSIASTFKHMVELRSSEMVIQNGGTGYRFNTDGNQVSYRCDVKRVTTINFDRNAIRKYLADMNKAADAASAALDRCLVNGAVEYEAPFDVNDSFADVFAAYTESRK
ncbi:MAG: hypothetical protein PHE09_11890 [Oscillospiraceae bacterium]|nr:hypothetical protein [Oscillospiraceae bacterium]